MKRWAIVTVGLYVVALVALTVPVFLACFAWGPRGWDHDNWQLIWVLTWWPYWVWIAVAALGQVLLLMVPVATAGGRPVARRRLRVPVITSALLLGLMSVAVVACVAVAIGKEDGLKIFGFPRTAEWSLPFLGSTDNQDELAARRWRALAVEWGYLIVSWTIWSVVFFRFCRHDDPQTLVRRLTTWLLRGSILELLVAVPSHVIVRHRGDCCAPQFTFWGIATGLTVMLMSFGPGVCFLFAQRMRGIRLDPRNAETIQTTVNLYRFRPEFRPSGAALNDGHG